MKTKYYIFTEDPMYKLNLVREGEQERDEIIAQWKQVYPKVTVYWHEVQEG